jgi:hypothetical protein
MLKKITLSVLFAITFAVGIGAAQASTMSHKTPTSPVPHGLCPEGTKC